MKKVLIASLFWALFSGGIVDAQAVLTVIPGSLTLSPDTFTAGNKISLSLTIKNIGNAAFDDPSIYLYYSTSTNPTPSLLTTLNDTNGISIGAGKTLAVHDILLLTDTIYFPRDTNRNIIVVWPTGIGLNGEMDTSVKFKPDSTNVVYSNNRRTSSILQPADENTGQTVKVYPNPAADVFYVQCQNQGTSIKSVQIIDIAGKQMMNWDMNNNQINIANLPKGIYLISITMSDYNVARYKVIKQ